MALAVSALLFVATRKLGLARFVPLLPLLSLHSVSAVDMSGITDAALVSGAAGLTTDDQTNAAERRSKGEFVRGVSTARHWIEDGRPDALYPAEAGRYHIYVGKNCPWCHRVMLGLAVLGIGQDVISVDVCFPNRSEEDEPLGAGLWKFCPEGLVGRNGAFVTFEDCTVDTVNGKKYVKEIYELAGITDQKSVPILFDKKTKTIVNNESSEILRMLGTVMKKFGTRGKEVDLYPPSLSKQIDEVNDWVYTAIANGAYKAGFSSNQSVHETACEKFFAALDRLNDNILSKHDFLVGNEVTEADLRLFPPLFRQDAVYYNRFKLNKRYLWEYPNIWRWMGRMMSLEGMEPVSNELYLRHCKQGYFGRTGNGVVPTGPPGYPEAYKKPPPFIVAKEPENNV